MAFLNTIFFSYSAAVTRAELRNILASKKERRLCRRAQLAENKTPFTEMSCFFASDLANCKVSPTPADTAATCVRAPCAAISPAGGDDDERAGRLPDLLRHPAAGAHPVRRFSRLLCYKISRIIDIWRTSTYPNKFCQTFRSENSYFPPHECKPLRFYETPVASPMTRGECENLCTLWKSLLCDLYQPAACQARGELRRSPK